MAPTDNQKLIAWVEEIAALTTPDRIEWCDGSAEEYDRLCELLVDPRHLHEPVGGQAAAQLLGPLRPGRRRPGGGPDVHLLDRRGRRRPDEPLAATPAEMRETLTGLFRGSMKGRTMYVVPFSMGPLGSDIAHIGVEITDSPYVAVSMRIMTRMGKGRSTSSARDGEFVPCLHSVGAPLADGQADVPWPCDAENKYIVHFPETREIWSYGSGYGGNALLGKKCFALRIASVMARDDGWLAEHMLILKLTSPDGETRYVTGAFPSACGKTNLAMLIPTLAGLEGRDDRRRHLLDEVRPGRPPLRHQPGGRFLRGRPGDELAHEPERHVLGRREHDLHEHRADRRWRRVVGRHDRRAAGPSDRLEGPGLDPGRRGRRPPTRTPGSPHRPPRTRRSPPNWEDPAGVPISAILFGGRRASVVPLVFQSFDWEHGVFLGSIMASETTAAAAGAVGNLRRDPFAMLPFCGYNMADYFAHWLEVGAAGDPAKLPKIFYVNWFRKNADGKWLWPGYGENSRVLEWVFERVSGGGDAIETPIGHIPAPGAIDIEGTDVSKEDLEELLRVDRDEWRAEVPLIREHFAKFGDRLPSELLTALDDLEQRLR